MRMVFLLLDEAQGAGQYRARVRRVLVRQAGEDLQVAGYAVCVQQFYEGAYRVVRDAEAGVRDAFARVGLRLVEREERDDWVRLVLTA